MIFHKRITGYFILLCVILLFSCTAGAALTPVNASLSADTVTPDAHLILSGTVPENATQMQVWSLACYRVIGVMSVPASCGASVKIVNVSSPAFVYTDLPTAEQGNYSIVVAFPGPDGSFGVGYDRAGQTLYFAGNNSVIANWTRSNPSEREEAAIITKAMAEPGIENPGATLFYTVVPAAGTQDAGKNVTAETTAPDGTPAVTASSAASHPSATTAPGFGVIVAIAGMIVAGVFLAGKKF
ncbi:MAG: PGF-CTERM sorting domain-containing protein [Methanoregula sp.]|nr:PGF-CTERM sorting domain-containing protein [Methanoregula sp.]